jgi:chemotaxis signal transduction protein
MALSHRDADPHQLVRPPSTAMLICRVAHERVAFDVGDVAVVLSAALTTSLPNSHAGDLGYLALRGSHVPAVQLSVLLGLGTRPMTPSDRFIILGSAEPRMAVLVDAVEGILPVMPLEPGLQSTLRLVQPGRISGEAGRIVAMVAADRLVAMVAADRLRPEVRLA